MRSNSFLRFAYASRHTRLQAVFVRLTVFVVFVLPFRVHARVSGLTVPGRTLIVVAHPDDEYYFTATVYKMAVQLHSDVDELIITDGEGGFRYSTLAEPYYRKDLTTEAVGRNSLPAIRKHEALQAGRILGIRHHYFLNQKDEGFTLDALAGQKAGWNFAFVTKKITNLIRTEHYRYLFVILPRSTTHGHHQAAAALASEAIQSLPSKERPLLLGFDTAPSTFAPTVFSEKNQRWDAAYTYSFDRTRHFGFHDALNYQIVVNWMIAEHKSQGLLQTMCGIDPKEYAWIAEQSAPDARTRAELLFDLLSLGVTTGRSKH
jgi:LmbE family N-acetylglucosaminyl deacetylase